MSAGNLFRAIRGPIMLITIGALFAIDHMGMFGFDRTWPLLIIVFGVLKLLERATGEEQPPYPPQPPYSGPAQPPYGAPPTGGAAPGGMTGGVS